MMKDIDFDELDRAVSSLMGSVDAPKKEAEAEASSAPSQVAPAPVTTSETEVKMEKEEALATDETIAAEPAPSPAIQRRSTGRYMDMVAGNKQPTSTLQTHREAAIARVADETAAQSAPIQDVAPTITTGVVTDTQSPLGDSALEISTMSREQEIDEASSLETVPEDIIGAPAPGSLDAEMQAKLEAALGTSHQESPGDSSDNNKKASESSLVDSLPELDDTSSITDSPFISDAKIEKRPLGQANPDLKPAADIAAMGVVESEPMIEQQEESGYPVVEPLPAELQGDILAVESDAIVTESPIESITFETNDIASSAAQPGVAVSIPQQYKQKASTGDQEHMPIYDTNVQPLEHPAKKKSSWGAILLILLLIVLGVGGAFAAYYFKLV